MELAHPAVMTRLGDVLLAVARTFSAVARTRLAAQPGLQERFAAILAFSNQLRSPQLSSEVYQQLSACNGALA
jgi:hypothetical protein